MNCVIKQLVELEDFVRQLQVEGNVVEVSQLTDHNFEVRWVKGKTYIAFDGTEYPDEAWVTEDGRMLLIQDLSEDHAKNIIRMIIRQDRETAVRVQELANKMSEAFESGGFDALMDLEPSAKNEDAPPVGSYLH